ncbi:hypothetical protein DdX_05732 [Ditylenchus destructor]|uniref:Uncharacterized protein n=1 Tax=Ditylenchus destructor TaxID=166010 RepID=A0AAD4NCN9_9BILA|nr:hypothetical protein DdX_05732 [Ditylenchus destructor]
MQISLKQINRRTEINDLDDKGALIWPTVRFSHNSADFLRVEPIQASLADFFIEFPTGAIGFKIHHLLASGIGEEKNKVAL